ncbi:epoxide hydrolase 1-like [Cheilinus undulatus]|uniref:epoxide hydrolase 1-like n=1 Tax=Cheilinus undulatus TaxID=241271 RepID=UPI001BD5E9BC|nr:epoxide hydrolase 1-like [Cheilinus undulatus]XP_041644708.1 epoxide hydrolase 1-like [Cheilinus undulatus]XP_041644709.1 epoxide hydrolase 1-like [Cheilinus undulatus]XP_041644710.1 epoxide hydrolase 1-like [Cheilinus undulatus]
MEGLQVLMETLLGLDLVQKLIGTAIAAGGILAYMIYKRGQVKTIPLGEGWWGAGEKPLSEDDKIYPFTVETSDEEIKDLHDRIDRTRYTESLEDSRFHYGFNSTHLKKVVKYWRHEFDWKKQVAELNKFPHFKTKIEGLDVHFIHVRPQHRANQRVLPLMLVHGWPGSFYEFYKILPLLTERQGDVVFEVVCPSIPGYGYSEAPHKQGFNSLAAARVFLTLMERLGFSEFYLQGGDWGSLITTNMAQMKPECVKGLHLNMILSTRGLKVLVSLLIGPYLPFLVGFSQEDVRRVFPFMEKNVYELLRESGYLHIQGTKPDTAGCGVNDSPVGLAAYILEKFCTWTDMKNRDLEDGGLEKKFSLDELLTNLMIYWTTGSIVPSMRFYKENLKTNIDNRVDSKTAVYVPTGLAAFPGELTHTPKSWAEMRYKKIYSYTFMPRGGHFAAFEEPQLLADDVIQFVKKVEQH